MIADFSEFSLTHSDTNGAIINGDCFEVLEILATRHPEGLADTIFSDPPYFLSNGWDHGDIQFVIRFVAKKHST